MKKADRISLWILTVGALLAATAILITAIMGVVHDMTIDSTVLHLTVHAKVPDDFFGAGPRIDYASFTQAEVETSALSAGVVSWLNTASAVGALARVLVALAMAYLGWRLLRGDPFRRSLTLALVIAAASLIVGTALSTAITFFATNFALQELVGGGFMSARYPFSFDFTPAVVGIALGFVAGAFEYGEKLKADTEGLV